MTSARQRWLGWTAVLLWMGMIFAGSTDLLSDHRTSRFLGPFLRWLIPGISDATIEVMRFPIRKAGHLTEYAVLAGLVFSALQGTFDLRRWVWHPRWVILALGISALYAVSDEWHQSWEPTRQASPVDVGIDTVGAILGLVVLWRLGAWWQARSLRRRGGDARGGTIEEGGC